MIWAKVGSQRFWPAMVADAADWPVELADESEPALPGEFAVRFLGPDEAWSWASHHNTVSWEAGDEAGRFAKGTGSKREDFVAAIAEGSAAFRAAADAKRERRAKLSGVLSAGEKPPPYRKIRTNLYTFPRPSIKELRNIPGYPEECACSKFDGDCSPESCLNSCMLVCQSTESTIKIILAFRVE